MFAVATPQKPTVNQSEPIGHAGDGSGRGNRPEACATRTLLRTVSGAHFRASELAAVASRDLESEGDDSGRLTIRRSKTNQEGEGTGAYLAPTTMTALNN